METNATTIQEPPADATGHIGGPGLEIWISYVLRIGVLIAAAIILVGLVLLIIRAPANSGQTSLHQIVKSEQTLSVHPSAVLRGVGEGNAVNIIQLGIFVLVLTPVMRVAMTVILFTFQRDIVFICITLTVLLILLFGLTGLGA